MSSLWQTVSVLHYNRYSTIKLSLRRQCCTKRIEKEDWCIDFAHTANILFQLRTFGSKRCSPARNAMRHLALAISNNGYRAACSLCWASLSAYSYCLDLTTYLVSYCWLRHHWLYLPSVSVSWSAPFLTREVEKIKKPDLFDTASTFTSATSTYRALAPHASC